jgi:hypothetical protein
VENILTVTIEVTKVLIAVNEGVEQRKGSHQRCVFIGGARPSHPHPPPNPPSHKIP